MTFQEACEAMGYTQPPDLSEESQAIMIETAERLSENGTIAIEPGLANLCRAQAEMFL